jgi:hypothetical protein
VGRRRSLVFVVGFVLFVVWEGCLFEFVVGELGSCAATARTHSHGNVPHKLGWLKSTSGAAVWIGAIVCCLWAGAVDEVACGM